MSKVLQNITNNGTNNDNKEDFISILLQRCDSYFTKHKISSPKKKKIKMKDTTNNNENRRNYRTERLTEEEEDKLIMQDELNQLNESSSHTRFTKQPPNIKFGTMRPYQLEGLNWLINLWNKGISGILADEMGLGKTLQSISMLAYLKHYQKNNGPHLVVVPLSVLGNWYKEFSKWCPDLNVFIFHGSKDERPVLVEQLGKSQYYNWDI